MYQTHGTVSLILYRALQSWRRVTEDFICISGELFRMCVDRHGGGAFVLIKFAHVMVNALPLLLM